MDTLQRAVEPTAGPLSGEMSVKMATSVTEAVNAGSEPEWIVLPRDSIKDTIESIIVAFILAFVFRAFLVEAFIIPTGSMAPTMYGAHATIVCSDCGTEFAYGLKDASRSGNSIPSISPGDVAYCPNCNHGNSPLAINDNERNYESGDRILVMKWQYGYDWLGLGPKRWDVTVFKNPSNWADNYIKRLVGLPGEVLMIADGDVYTVPTESLSEKAFKELDNQRHLKYEFRTGRRTGRMAPISRETMAELCEKMRITRKSRVAQEELWFPVYDHNWPPHQLDGDQPFWLAIQNEQSGWNLSGATLRYDGSDLADDYIVLASATSRAYNAYNVFLTRDRQVAPQVSDMRVRGVFTPRDPEAKLQIRLEKEGCVFWAELDGRGRVAIYQVDDSGASSAKELGSTTVSGIWVDRSALISFEHVDYRVSLKVGGEEVLATSFDPDSPSYYAPDLKKILNRGRPSYAQLPRMYGSGGAFELVHVAVERDVYYRSPDPRRDRFNWPAWSNGTWGTQGNPILLRSWEYYMLGDNSAASQDSRLWSQAGPHLTQRGEEFQLGTVPADQLVGRAFFVYWPSGIRIPWLPPLDRYGIVPDVGRMRWIR